MGFASAVRKEITIGEDTFHVRKLSGHSLEKAEQAHRIAQAANMRAMGGDIMKALRSEEMDEAAKSLAAKRATAEGRRKERYEKYDRESVLVAGVVSWTLDADVSRASINDLDQETWDALYREILDLSLGPLDADADPKEAATEVSISS